MPRIVRDRLLSLSIFSNVEGWRLSIQHQGWFTDLQLLEVALYYRIIHSSFPLVGIKDWSP